MLRCRTTASTWCRVACQMVQAFQTIITRNKRPIDTAVISVTMIHAGEATNVVPTAARSGHGAHLHHRGAGPDRAAHARIAEAHQRRLQATCEFASSATTRPPSTTRPRPPFARACWARWWAGQRAGVREPTMGARTSATCCRRVRAATSSSATATATTARWATAGPCMLHNPSYDFNDELIPLGATAWCSWPKWLTANDSPRR